MGVLAHLMIPRNENILWSPWLPANGISIVIKKNVCVNRSYIYIKEYQLRNDGKPEQLTQNEQFLA